MLGHGLNNKFLPSPKFVLIRYGNEKKHLLLLRRAPFEPHFISEH